MRSFEALREKALSLGFSAVGVAKVEKLSAARGRLEEWVAAGRHAGLGYMERNADKREDPTLLLEGAQSIIVTLSNYYTSFTPVGVPLISKYAYGKDYHIVVKSGLRQLMDGMDGRCFVDSAPVFEHEWARRAGLGWLGKNTLLINKQWGSFCFIGVIITTARFDRYSDETNQSHCGTCSRCVDACPVQALSAAGLDASRCISYHTIENKETYPEEIKQRAGNRLFGCDTCQDVCPWNRRLKEHSCRAFDMPAEVAHLGREDWLQMDELRFRELFSDTPLERAGLEQIVRNLK
jgi:epoxyqueuosine reductase